jgi:hypothetical protein
VFRYFNLWQEGIKGEQWYQVEGNKILDAKVEPDLCCATAQVRFSRPLPLEGRGLGRKSRGL